MEESHHEHKGHEQKEHHEHHGAHHDKKGWYDKYYKLLLLIPILVLLIAAFQLYSFHLDNGDIIRKDVSLTGGTTVSVFDSGVSIDEVRAGIADEVPDISIRVISDFRTGAQRGFILETQAEVDIVRSALEDFLGYELTQDNSSIEFSGAALSQGFYSQLKNAILAAFLLMGWVVFYMFGESRKIKGLTLMLTFIGISIALPQVSAMKVLAGLSIVLGFILAMTEKRKKNNDFYLITGIALLCILLLTFKTAHPFVLALISIILLLAYGFYSIPSVAVILAAFSDIVMTIAVVNLTGIALSTAGVIALLLLIGYSVDTDILLTTRVLKKKEGKLNEKIADALKTGATMTFTSIVAIGASLFVVYNSSEVLRQIFTILLIGLGFDLFNTWFANASIIKWYAEKTGAHK